MIHKLNIARKDTTARKLRQETKKVNYIMAAWNDLQSKKLF